MYGRALKPLCLTFQPYIFLAVVAGVGKLPSHYLFTRVALETMTTRIPSFFPRSAPASLTRSNDLKVRKCLLFEFNDFAINGVTMPISELISILSRLVATRKSTARRRHCAMHFDSIHICESESIDRWLTSTQMLSRCILN